MLQNFNGLKTTAIKKILKNQLSRKEAVKQSHLLFFHYYFSNYIEYETADFQREIFSVTEDDDLFLAIIIAFRSSGKSTIIGRSYPIWSIIGRQQKKFVVLIGQTQNRTQEMMQSIKAELEENELLNKDLGKFYEKQEPWNTSSLYIEKYDAKITAVSSQEAVRGMLYKGRRPDLIIGDDVEDIRSNEQQDIRDKNYRWFKHEIVPLGNKKTKIIMIGNLLHPDSLLLRLKNEIEDNKLNVKAKYYEYPLIDDNGNCLWPGMYSPQDIQELKDKVNNDRAWKQEFLLKILAAEDQVIMPEWIHYYDELPNEKLLSSATGIDLAISESDKACYTAMVSVKVLEINKEVKYYVMPFPVNKRLDFDATMQTAMNVSLALGNGQATPLYVEEVAYQPSAIQTLENNGLPVEGIKINGADKRSRLVTISHLIKNGKILFPRNGAETLITQLVYFHSEKYKDLCDAFTMVITKLSNEYLNYGHHAKISTGCPSAFSLSPIEFEKLEHAENKRFRREHPDFE